MLELQVTSLEGKEPSRLVDSIVHLEGGIRNAYNKCLEPSNALQSTFCYESDARTLSRKGGNDFLSDAKLRGHNSQEEFNATRILNAQDEFEVQATCAEEREAVRGKECALRRERAAQRAHRLAHQNEDIRLLESPEVCLGDKGDVQNSLCEI